MRPRLRIAESRCSSASARVYGSSVAPSTRSKIRHASADRLLSIRFRACINSSAWSRTRSSQLTHNLQRSVNRPRHPTGPRGAGRRPLEYRRGSDRETHPRGDDSRPTFHDYVVAGFLGHPAEGSAPVRPSVAVAAAASALASAGIAPARVEAEWLVAYVLDVPRGALALGGPLSAAQLDRLRELVQRRIRHEPLQHLLGTAPFRYLELAVGPGVFVPRPETELLAGWGIEAARRLAPEGGAVVVDLCSGTGAIALAVADEVPGARVFAVERSAAALTWLRRNAEHQRDAGQRAASVEVVAADVADPGLLDALAGRVDVLLCNPPYVPDGTAVPPEVAEHDPAEAVFGGPDGLAVIRLVVARAARLLRPGGVLGIEHDDTHGAAVPALLRADGRFVDIAAHPDLLDRPRFATATRAG
ncbi:peptide chain release factor N(5)-glutamine methyltransferase [Plantactinospora sp. CA-290183]|uniref:peptide chain release factor N(5)-glutamine methyltransferase n=1 Tax=Plantactinospora sp. CA-290183 TaxID=3240006 RepID=UPI003D90994C